MDTDRSSTFRILFASYRRTAFWSFRLAWRTSKRLFLTIMACFGLESFIPVVSTAAIGMLVSQYASVTEQPDIGFGTLVFWLSVTIGLIAAEMILVEIRKYCRVRLVDEAGIDLQKEMYLHTSRMDVTFFERSDSLNKLFRAGVSGANGALGPVQSAMAATAGLVQILSLFAMMAYLQPLPALVLFVAGLPLLAIRSVSAVEEYNLEVKTTQRRRLSRYFTSLLSNEANIKATKILGLADELVNRFEESARSVVSEKREILRKISYRLGVSALFYLAVLAGILVWLSFTFSRGDIEPRAMVVFLLAAFRSLRSFNQVSGALASGTDAALTLIPLLEFLDEEPRVIDRGGRTPDTLEGRIVLENVSFIYPGTTRRVIDTLSFTISPGEKVAIVGHNGAGKTTLIKLISRFYDADEGHILIDENRIEDVSLRWLHDHLAMVFQRPVQFEATVHDNVAFGDWERLRHEPEVVRDLAMKTGLNQLIEKLPDGFDTHLGKLFGDTTLSQGQWQLIEVARAMAREDAIVILDEPTSNLDIHAEAALFRAIQENAGDRTVLFVSNRFSTVKEADRILVLNEGRLVEAGPHEQLMETGGYYAEMVRAQRDGVRK